MVFLVCEAPRELTFGLVVVAAAGHGRGAKSLREWAEQQWSAVLSEDDDCVG